jgi:hypothetical protein
MAGGHASAIFFTSAASIRSLWWSRSLRLASKTGQRDKTQKKGFPVGDSVYPVTQNAPGMPARALAGGSAGMSVLDCLLWSRGPLLHRGRA